MDKSSDDVSNWSGDLLISEYHTLHKLYSELKQSDQRQRQEIHQLRRELQTALNDKNHLSSELEIINTDHSNEIQLIQTQHRDELNGLKDRLSKYKDDLELVENERDGLAVIVEEKQSAEQTEIAPVVSVDNNQSFYTEKLDQLETENDELAGVVENLQDELKKTLKESLQFERQIEDLTDRLKCAEENHKAKRDEIEEKNELLETAQERVIQLSGELNALQSESDTAAKRGNSLFAEVDDQRQQMKALLQAQKANYLEMKKELEMSRQEIRKLKRENAAMYKEIEICSHVFLNAEQHHTEKLNERIAELMRENEAINKKLNFTEECLSNMIKKNNVNWLDPMFKLCENETKDLKDQLYRYSIQKVEIAGALRQSEEETARWRFEALKSRCIIADRENLLESNKIPFGAVRDIERKIKKIDNENVVPNIAARKSLLSYKRKSLTKNHSPQNNAQLPARNSPNTYGRTATSNENGSTSVVINSKNELNVKLQPEETESATNNELKIKSESHETETTTKADETKSTEITQRNLTDNLEKKPVHYSDLKPLVFSGVTFRKKITASETATLAKDNKTDNGIMANTTSPGTCFPSSTQPKIKPIQNSTGGILKLSTNSNIHSEKKVKFGGGSAANKEKPSSVRKVETSDGVQKTAIKRRIFIPTKKPTNNPQ